MKRTITALCFLVLALPLFTSVEANEKGVRFKDNGDGTVTDTKTSLMWAAKDNGKGIKWADAKQYCEFYSAGGHKDWRMPTQDELAGLYDPAETNAAKCHVTPLIGISSCPVWAVETRESKAAFFEFSGGGGRGWDDPASSFVAYNRALPVRGGK